MTIEKCLSRPTMVSAHSECIMIDIEILWVQCASTTMLSVLCFDDAECYVALIYLGLIVRESPLGVIWYCVSTCTIHCSCTLLHCNSV